MRGDRTTIFKNFTLPSRYNHHCSTTYPIMLRCPRSIKPETALTNLFLLFQSEVLPNFFPKIRKSSTLDPSSPNLHLFSLIHQQTIIFTKQTPITQKISKTLLPISSNTFHTSQLLSPNHTNRKNFRKHRHSTTKAYPKPNQSILIKPSTTNSTPNSNSTNTINHLPPIQNGNGRGKIPGD